ncbi:siderophore ABC transporter substrate-binding protein [Vagococcus sp.]|uniref:siderophore ABC transporter substrate-binding protein n=1 Tax=Vagococcus sp. TaxID=1933889 RepID=UPI003F98A45F
MKKKFSFLVIFVAMMGLLAACGKTENKVSSTKETKETTKKMVKVTDGEGKEVEVPNQPKKVIVFDLGSLDTISALGGKESIVALPEIKMPAYLEKEFKKTEKAGGIKEPDLEKINALQPDLIIISGRQQEAQASLAKIAPTLYLGIDSANAWTSTKQNIETLGTIYGKEAEAKQAVNKLDKKVLEIKEIAEKSDKKALMTLVNEGSLSAYGAGSRFGMVFSDFGVKAADENIEVSTHGQEVSYEYVLEKNPDILYVIDRTKAIGGDTSKNNVNDNELVQQTKAGKTDKVISLTPDVWYLASGGITSTQLMIEDIQKGYK